MTVLQALAITVLQGITELFPVSSLGHAVILPVLLGWHIDQRAESFLPFLVVLHLGTATTLFAYFWRDWLDLGLALFDIGAEDEVMEGRRLIWLIAVATLPVLVLGFTLEKEFRHLFGAPQAAAAFLMVNGGVLFAGERLRHQTSSGELRTLTRKGALAVGLWQCTALIPGISRSGATILGGLLAGLHHKAAARFSFLIATPIIFAAGVLEVPKMFHHASQGGRGIVWLAGTAAAISAYISVAFLMRYFRNHDLDALDPFAYYCLGAGALSLIALLA